MKFPSFGQRGIGGKDTEKNGTFPFPLFFLDGFLSDEPAISCLPCRKTSDWP